MFWIESLGLFRMAEQTCGEFGPGTPEWDGHVTALQDTHKVLKEKVDTFMANCDLDDYTFSPQRRDGGRTDRIKDVVLDLMMPGMEGWDFRHEQKRDPKLTTIPVIGVSAAGKLVDVEFSFLKPLRYDEFLKAVKRYVD